MSPPERYLLEFEGSRTEAPSHLIHIDGERSRGPHEIRRRVRGSRRPGLVTRELNT